MSAYLVCVLKCLVDSNSRCGPHDICLGPESFAEFQRICTVQASRAVIPTLERRITQRSLGYGDTLPLAATYAPNKVIIDTGVLRMRDAKHCHGHIAEMFGVLTESYAFRYVLGAAGASGQVECIADGQLREMVIYMSTSAV